MTTDSRLEIIALLGEVGDLAPDVRIGQLLAHLGLLGEVHLGRGLNDIDDDELVAILYRHRAELLDRLKGASSQPQQSGAPFTSVSGSPTLPESVQPSEPSL